MHVIAPIERQLLYLPLIHHASHLARSGVDSLAPAARSDLHCLRHLPGFEREIDREARVRRQRYIGLSGLLEALALGHDRVSADRQVRHCVEAVLVRHGGARQIGGRIGHGDGGGGHDRAGGVLHRARDATDDCLRAEVYGAARQQQQDCAAVPRGGAS